MSILATSPSTFSAMLQLFVLLLSMSMTASFTFATPRPFNSVAATAILSTPSSSTTLHMFGGGAPGATLEDEAMEAQAKQMGMNLKEYQLAMKMRERIATNLGNHRSTGTAFAGAEEVSITYDGNVKPISVTIPEKALTLSKEKLQDGILTAWTGAIGESQKAAQREFAAMQADIKKEIS